MISHQTCPTNGSTTLFDDYHVCYRSVRRHHDLLGDHSRVGKDQGNSKFGNVSKYLIYTYADIDDDGDPERLALFDDRLEGYLWGYDSSGLKLAQLRFYECESIVPDADNPEGATDDTACFSGAH